MMGSKGVYKKLLNGVTATGAGAAHGLGTNPSNKHTLQTVFTNSGGAVTALTIDLEGSLDGTNYQQIATKTFAAGDLTAKSYMFHVTNKPVSHVRANITTLTETGATAVSAHYLNGGV